MAGEKQHIVPQFLQRNFSIDENKKKVRIYLVKDKKIVATGIRNNIQKKIIMVNQEKLRMF